ncbi:hypothetical protein CROQUDRAFT_34791, partial [Cronartium quercuum f. sp. fusiforme G11]
DMEVNLRDRSTPPVGRIYPLSQVEEAELDAYLDAQLEEGFIRKSSSPAVSPIFFVKVDGK